jgi:hypothetical protein
MAWSSLQELTFQTFISWPTESHFNDTSAAIPHRGSVRTRGLNRSFTLSPIHALICIKVGGRLQHQITV